MSADYDKQIRKRLKELNRKIHKVQLRLHNKKARSSIPRLQAELHALYKAKDEVLRGNLQNVPKKIVAPKLCPVCNERLGKGYHICKPQGQWK